MIKHENWFHWTYPRALGTQGSPESLLGLRARNSPGALASALIKNRICSIFWEKFRFYQSTKPTLIQSSALCSRDKSLLLAPSSKIWSLIPLPVWLNSIYKFQFNSLPSIIPIFSLTLYSFPKSVTIWDTMWHTILLKLDCCKWNNETQLVVVDSIFLISAHIWEWNRQIDFYKSLLSAETFSCRS